MNGKQVDYQEKALHAPNGLAVLLINIVPVSYTHLGDWAGGARGRDPLV